MKRRVIGAMVLTLALFTVACSKKTTAGTTTTAPATTRGATTTTRTGASASPSPSASASFSGQGAAAYCDLAKKYEQLGQNLSNNNPDDVKKQVDLLKAAIADVQKVVPAEIKADWDVLIPALRQFIAAIEEAGYDFSKVDQSKLESFNTPEVQSASDRIEQHSKQVCGTTG